MLPGRKIVIGLTLVSTTVDSSPILLSPPSTIILTLFIKSALTCSSFVDDGLPDRLAEGAARGTPASLIIF